MRAPQPALVGTGGLPTARLWATWLGDPDTVSRFTAKVYRRANEACWPWCGALDADGHGSFRAGSRRRGTSWVIAAHVFAYQLAHGLCAPRLLAADVVIRHRCDEACCQNPAHLALGTASMNIAEYRARRHRVGGPLGDTRGSGGRARAIRAAVLAARAEGPDAVEAALAAALTAGDRQLDALDKAGIPAERIYVDKKSGAGTDRPGLRALLGYARDGDVIVVHTLDRLGRTVRDTLNLIHDLAERGVGIRNLADPIRVDSTCPEDPMAALAVVLLALFAQMERTYAIERAAHAAPWPPPGAAASGARSPSTRPSWRGLSTCATKAPPSPRSSPPPASRAPACIATCRPARPSRSPPPARTGDL